MASSFRPYILADNNSSLDVSGLESKLKSAGFDVLGVAQPAKGYTTVAFTHTDLKKEAAKATVPIGAVLRASLVKTDGKTQLSYNSPHYWAYASGLPGKSSDSIAQKLSDFLGYESDFGCAKGKTEKQLRSYSYAMGMPRLTDLDRLQNFDSFADAARSVEQSIGASNDVEQVYQIDVAKNSRMIGVTIKAPKGSDATILDVADAANEEKMGGLYGPYELFINNKGEVSTTRGRFRIAVAFPDLRMSTFMRIVQAPPTILSALKTSTQQLGATCA